MSSSWHRRKQCQIWGGFLDDSCFNLSLIDIPLSCPVYGTVKQILFRSQSAHLLAPIPILHSSPQRIPLSQLTCCFLWEVFPDAGIWIRQPFCGISWRSAVSSCSFLLSLLSQLQVQWQWRCWLCVPWGWPGARLGSVKCPKWMNEWFCKCVQFVFYTE